MDMWLLSVCQILLIFLDAFFAVKIGFSGKISYNIFIKKDS